MITRSEVLDALPEWLTVAGAAALAGVSRVTVYKRIDAGRMETRTAEQRGRAVLMVRTRDVLAWREARRSGLG